MDKQFIIYKKKGYLIIIFGFLGFFLWASFFKINKGVYSQGFLVAQNDKIEIISPISALISNLNVTPGKLVNKGEIIISFNDKLIQTQIKSLQNTISLEKENLLILEKQLENQIKLVEKGIMNENGLLPKKSEIFLTASKLERDKGKHNELREKLNLLKIKSPIKGSVMNLTVSSSNINVREGQHLLDIIPFNQNLLASIQIPVNFGNKVTEGMKVDITFPTLIGSNMKKIEGNLIYLSADKINIDDKFYFEGKVEIEMLDISNKDEIKTGLPVAAIIKTGENSMLSYILKPIKDRINKGLQ